MKRPFVSLSLFGAFFLLLVPGCKKGPVPQEPVLQEEETFDLSDAQELIEEKLIPSVVLAPSAGLNILGRDNTMHRMKSLSRGDTFETVFLNGETSSLNLYDEKETPETYIHAVSENVDFWIFENYVAKNAVPAIIIEAEEGLKFGSIVGLSLEEGEDGESVVFYFDRSQERVVERSIASAKVSTYTDDVRMAEIIEKLKTTTRATPRNELFLKAEKLNASPNMKKILDAQKTEKLSYDYQEVLKSMPGARYIVNVEELNTVDQSKDPFKN